jgi:uroporphyrinogen decarboxylase
MTSRDLVLSSLNHQPIDRTPRDLWYVPGVESSHADDIAEIEVRYPRDIERADFKYSQGKRAKGKTGRVGQYTDAWGCTWQVDTRGTPGRIVDHPLADSSKIASYQPPFELVSGDRHVQARLTRANQACAATSRFVLAWTETRPFDRLQMLRGSDAALADLESESPEVRSLLAMLHDFSCRDIEMWADSDVDGVALGDDFGSPESLLVTPEVWQEFFRPMYRDYCKILHAKDKFVFFHSQGNISKIFGELIKLGIDAIHTELSLMDFPRLAKRYRGRVTFWGGIDDRHLLPSGSPEEVADAVMRIRKALDFGSGGLIAQCRWGPDVPLQNIAAIFEQWLMPLPMHA